MPLGPFALPSFRLQRSLNIPCYYNYHGSETIVTADHALTEFANLKFFDCCLKGNYKYRTSITSVIH